MIVLSLLTLSALALAQVGPAPDPSQDPGAFWDALRAAFDSAPLVGVVLALWGLSRLAYRFRDKLTLIPWVGESLGTPRARALLVGATASLATTATSMMAGMSPGPAMVALLAGLVSLYLAPEPQA